MDPNTANQSDPPGWYFDTFVELSKTSSRLFLVLLSISSYFAIALFGLDDLQLILPTARVELPLIRVAVPTLSFLVGGQLLLLSAMMYCYLSLDRLETLLFSQRTYWRENPLRLYGWLVSARLVRESPDTFFTLSNRLVSALLFLLPLFCLVGLTLFGVKTHVTELVALLISFSVVGMAIVLVFRRRSRRRWDVQSAVRKDAVEFGISLLISVLMVALMLIAPRYDTQIFNIWLTDRTVVSRQLQEASAPNPSIKFATDLNLQFAKLSGVRLPGIHMVRARLDHATLWFSDLSGAYLVASHLVDAGLVDANLAAANLAFVEAQRANFSGADLSEADLGSARLQHANFRGANLTGASLHGARLTGADFGKIEYGTKEQLVSELIPEYYDSRATLTDARISVHTTLPDGKDLTESSFPWKERGMIVVNREGFALDPQPEQQAGLPK